MFKVILSLIYVLNSYMYYNNDLLTSLIYQKLGVHVKIPLPPGLSFFKLFSLYLFLIAELKKKSIADI